MPVQEASHFPLQTNSPLFPGRTSAQHLLSWMGYLNGLPNLHFQEGSANEKAERRIGRGKEMHLTRVFIPLSSTLRGHHRLSHHQRLQLFSSFEKMTALGMVTALLFLTPGHHIVSEVSTQPAYSLVNY